MVGENSQCNIYFLVTGPGTEGHRSRGEVHLPSRWLFVSVCYLGLGYNENTEGLWMPGCLSHVLSHAQVRTSSGILSWCRWSCRHQQRCHFLLWWRESLSWDSNKCTDRSTWKLLREDRKCPPVRDSLPGSSHSHARAHCGDL